LNAGKSPPIRRDRPMAGPVPVLLLILPLLTLRHCHRVIDLSNECF
jgi:hypothetical protein